MRKILVILLAAMLLVLGGCAQPEDTEPTQPEQTTTQATEPGLYVPDSRFEQQTAGALRLFALPEGSYDSVCKIGNDLVLIKSGEQTELTLLCGETRVAEKPVVVQEDFDKTVWQAGAGGICYYDRDAKQVLFLDPQLEKTDSITMPEDIQGMPVFAPDCEEIFYCAGQQIRGIDTENKIDRIIKSHTCETQALTGCYFEGKLLACHTTYEDGSQQTLYIAAENGETLFIYNDLTSLYTCDDSFFATRKDGIINQTFFGMQEGVMQQLNLSGNTVIPVLELGGALEYSVDDSGKTGFCLYDLASGKKTAAIAVADIGPIKAILADKWTNSVWLLTQEKGADILLCWNPKATAVTEETVYTGTFFYADAPDEEGIAACKERAEELSKTHGVKIRLWESAVKYPGDLALEAEYQPEAINGCLDELTKVLEQFPKKFLKLTISNQLRVCIVRSVNAQHRCAWYWNGSSFYIILSAGTDIRDGFVKGLAYAVDSHILGNSSRYDYWKPLNPDGFDYADPATHLEAYLQGDTRAFADEISMTSVTEDRSRIFYQAMQPDNAQMFQSKIMQEKLHLMCKAIRSAWSWKKVADVFPWEQYLEEPLAYKK